MDVHSEYIVYGVYSFLLRTFRIIEINIYGVHPSFINLVRRMIANNAVLKVLLLPLEIAVI